MDVFLPLEMVFLMTIPAFILADAASTNVLIATTVVGFMTVVVQQAFSAYNVRKAHRDDMEERDNRARALAASYVAENEKIRLQTDLRAVEVRLLVEQRQLEITKEQARQTMLLLANTKDTQLTAEITKEILGTHKETAEIVDAKLDQIHTLVNSNMTAAMESELYAHKANRVLLDEAVGSKRALGQEPSEETLAMIDTVTAKIAELEAKLKDRIRTADQANHYDRVIRTFIERDVKEDKTNE